MSDVAASQTACYVGTCTQDYYDLLVKDPEVTTQHAATGIGKGLVACRLSWFYDLRGPALTVDTACSSALVGLHLACQSLRNGESKQALVAGTNLMLAPDTMIWMSSLHALSAEGQCSTFDRNADGYARGEGVACIMVKPLADALRDNDVIRGVIRGTAVNQDGGTAGITSPSAEAQIELIRTAYRNAGISFDETGYFEAHGTGTVVGDLQETSAMAATFGKTRSKENPLYIGSSKTNIGHMEGASGLGGLIKALCSLEHGIIAPNVAFEEAPSTIPLYEWNLKVPTKAIPWPTAGQRRISVNGFGFGGTNAHAILDDAYHYMKEHGLEGQHNCIVDDAAMGSPSSAADSGIGLNALSTVGSDDEASSDNFHRTFEKHLSTLGTATKLLIFSSNEKKGLARSIEALTDYINEKSETGADNTFIDRLSYTLAKRRSLFNWRSFAMVSSLSDISSQLSESLVPPIRSKYQPSLGLVFTGQGAQWYAMGRELSCYEMFAQSLAEADTYLLSLGSSWSILEEFAKDKKSSKVDNPDVSQALCTALQIALIDLLQHWKVTPKAVVGHSSGEIAAAYAKGAISRQYALKAAYFRGLYASQLKQIAPHLDGGMLAVGLGEEALEPYLETFKANASIACFNSPGSITVSGDAGTLDELTAALQKDGVFARKLKVNMAYHSSHMGEIAELYRASIKDEKPLEIDDSVHMVSSVTGSLLKSSDLTPDYWVSNLMSPVRFDQAVQKLVSSDKTSVDLFLEVGPHGALQGPLKQILAAKNVDVPCSSLLQRGQDAVATVLEAMGRLFQHGTNIDIDLVNQRRTAGRTVPTAILVDLPPYPWNHENKYWHETSISKDIRFRKNPRHNLLGALLPGCTPFAPIWRNHLRVSESPWLEDHKVQKTILLPAAGMLVMAIQAVWEISDSQDQADGFELRDVRITRGLVIPGDEIGIETLVQLKPRRIGTSSDTSVWQEFTVSSRSEDDVWQQHCSGLARLKLKSQVNGDFQDEEAAEAAAMKSTYETLKTDCTKSEAPRQFYESLATVGYQYGPTFRNLTKVTYGNLKSVCMVKIPDTKSDMPNNHEFPHIIHPAFLDSLFHMMLPTLMPGGLDMTAVGVPTFFEYLYVASDISNKPGVEMYGYSQAIPPLSRETNGNIVVADSEWKKPQVIVRNLRCTTVSSSSDNDTLSRKLGSHLLWKADVDQVKQDTLVAADQVLPDPSIAEDLELAAFTFVKRVLKAIRPEEVENFAHHLQLFYHYCERQHELASQHKFEHQTGNVDWLDTPQQYEVDLLARVESSSIDGRLLCNHGYHLEEIIRGQREALEVLTQDDMLDKYYSSHIGWDTAHQPLSSYLDLLAHKNPELKILDIGAGTGGTTGSLLRKLSGRHGASPRFRLYTYTDISPGFFGRAAEKFADWAPYMAFQKLDISENPANQGFEPQSYDVIIASNVLHATRSIDETLANTRSLLKPGGKLLLYEITHDMLTIPMIFGTLPGWWVGEKDGRKYGPCITEGQWSTSLLKAGFSGIDIAARNSASERDYVTTVMVATRTAEEPVQKLPKEVFIIASEEPNESSNLCSGLSKKLTDAGVVNSTMAISEALNSEIDNQYCIVMLEADHPWVHTATQTDFKAMQSLIHRSRNVMWLTRGATYGEIPEAALMAGLARVIRAENPSVALTTLDLDINRHLTSKCPAENFEAIIDVLGLAFVHRDDDCPDWEYAIRDGSVIIPRLVSDESTNAMLASTTSQRPPTLSPLKQKGRPVKLQIGTPGMLNALQFVADPLLEKPLAVDEVEIEVKATGLNSKDASIASGAVLIDELGFECSGVVTRVGSTVSKIKVGEKVVTWQLQNGCFREYLRNPESSFLHMPEDMSFEVAASLPTAFATAYYSLVRRAHLQKGESVLIHDGAGAVGEAAVKIALYLGVDVYTSVASTEEKDVVVKNGVPENHIFNNVDLSFAKGIKRITNGRGVDVVLNSLSDEGLQQSWHCIAPFGRFIELGQKDITGNTGLDMAPFSKNVTFIGVNMLDLCRQDTVTAAKVFAEVWELLRSGDIKSLHSIRVSNYSQLEDAFQTMHIGKDVEKVVLTLSEENEVMVSKMTSCDSFPQLTKHFRLFPKMCVPQTSIKTRLTSLWAPLAVWAQR
jgi:acyl transferase domain-containing protein/NADPH:quinone reductase-like Zn-dependent oxidoreductase/2-polyprenyl-3-methyl-5-hydroxy-6-metoxy-1,4-benzoquinol methylase